MTLRSAPSVLSESEGLTVSTDAPFGEAASAALSTSHGKPCYPCRHLVETVQDGRAVDICLRWRRKADRRCGEYEVGARIGSRTGVHDQPRMNS